MVSAQDITGALASFGIAFTTVVPFGLIITTLGFIGFITLLLSDWIGLGVIIGGIVFGVLVSGFVGVNSAKQGAAGGAITGFMISGAYLLYSILTGSLGFALFGASMDVVMIALCVGVLAVITMIYSAIVYVAGQYIKK